MSGGTYNVVCGDRVTLNELVASVRRVMGRPLEVHYAPPRGGDARHSMADISLAREELGYEVVVDFDERLAPAIEHYVAVGEVPARVEA